MAKLIGTDPNQVPTNGDLGDLAYQNKESVTIEGGTATLNADGDNPLTLNRESSDGTIVDLQKDGTSVGSIGTSTGDLTIGTAAMGLKFRDGDQDLIPWNTTTNGAANGVFDLGDGSNRWKDLYLSGGVYLGGTGSANYLDDYETGTWTPTAVAGITGFTVQSANYVKVGNIVTVNLYLNNWSGKSSVGLTIGGLPFTVKNLAYYTGSFDSASDGKMGMFRAQSNTSNFIAYYSNTSTGYRSNFLGTDLGTHLIGSFTYIAA